MSDLKVHKIGIGTEKLQALEEGDAPFNVSTIEIMIEKEEKKRNFKRLHIHTSFTSGRTQTE